MGQRVSSGGGVGEMCAERRLHEPSPGLMISAGPVESDPFPGGDQGSVQDLEFGTGGAAADGASRVFPQSCQEPGALHQVEVTGDGGGAEVRPPPV